MLAMNPLEEYFLSNKGRAISKWMHYFDIYHRHFQRFRNTPVTVLEIGVWEGGSLQMWKNYFGNQARIIGIDIDPKCKDFEEDNISIYIGSQDDALFLKHFKTCVPHIDIVIDDGGHMMHQQKISFRELYNHVSENGVYLVEDLHTSYWKRYGGGYQHQDSFIEYAKLLIDQLNAYHSEEKTKFDVNDFTQSTYSMCFYDSIIVFEKKRISPP